MNVFAIIVILVVALFLVAIVVNAIQQHKEKVEAEKRTEIAKQKSIIDETENVIMAASQFPLSQQLYFILHQRVLNALKVIFELNPNTPDIRQRLKDAEQRTQSINIDEPAPVDDGFQIPDDDKLIIQYIQGVKKLRIMLRSEHSKGKVDTQVFSQEDQKLDRLQLRINVDTLAKRGNSALKTNMLGSARQYFEKALNALSAQAKPDEYIITRKAQLEKQLGIIQENLRSANAQDAAKKQEEEKDDLDELFAPKKKW